MTKTDETCLDLGRMVVRMIHDLRTVPASEPAYSRRKITFPGGEVFIFLANKETLADQIDAAVRSIYNITDVTPDSLRN